MDLCNKLVIKSQYHHEYKYLKSSANVADVLEESDIDDAL